jgi:hypothetical protein
VFASPIFGSNGEIEQVVEVWRDITERKSREARMAEFQRMVSLGMLGPDPAMAVVSIDSGVTDLALTREPIGGSVAPSGAPMAAGHLV